MEFLFPTKKATALWKMESGMRDWYVEKTEIAHINMKITNKWINSMGYVQVYTFTEIIMYLFLAWWAFPFSGPYGL